MNLKTYCVILALAGIVIAGCTNRNATDTTAESITDNFNRDDGSLTASGLWTLETGSWTISNMMAHPTGVSSNSVFYTEAQPSTSYTTSVKLIVDGGTLTSPVIYLAAESPSLSVLSSQGYYCGFTGAMLYLFQGSSIPLASTAHTFDFSDGSEVTLTLTRLGTALTCTMSGDASATVTATASTSATTGYFGLYSSTSGAYVYFDDFDVDGI